MYDCLLGGGEREKKKQVGDLKSVNAMLKAEIYSLRAIMFANLVSSSASEMPNHQQVSPCHPAQAILPALHGNGVVCDRSGSVITKIDLHNTSIQLAPEPQVRDVCSSPVEIPTL